MDIGPGELVVVLVVVLLVFGSSRLPQLGRSLGEAMREVRKWSEPGERVDQ
ncbi:MAG: twin-arginine translocase TatA/TatE family subunit [Ilumatobacteraceae bacterium]